MNEYDIEKLLAEGQHVQLKPQGWSMYPTLVPNRDEVILGNVGSKYIHRGDVVLYRRSDGMLVLHRVYRRKGNQFYFVGDNQKEIEGPLNESQIKGIMEGFIRNGKRISVRNPIYRVLMWIWLVLRPCRPGISKMVHRGKELLKNHL